MCYAMNVKQLWLVVVLCCLVQPAHAKIDTNTVNTWNQQALDVAYSDPAKAMKLAEKSLEAARKLNFSRGEVRALIRMGIVYDIQAKNQLAIAKYEESLQLARKTKDIKAIASNLNNIGLIYWKDNRLSPALEYLNKAYSMFGKLGDDYNCASAANNIGLIYEEMRRADKALHWSRLALRHAFKAEDAAMINDIHSNIGNVYNSMEKADSAKFYSQKAIEGYRKTGNKYGLSMSLCNLGILLADEHRYKEAIPLYKESMELAQAIGNEYSYASSAYNLSNTYMSLKDYAAMEKVLEQVYPIARKLKSNELSYKIAFGISKAAYRKGDIPKGDHYMNAYLKYHKLYYEEVLDRNLIEAEKKIGVRNERARRLLERKAADLRLKRLSDARFNDNLLWSAAAVIVLFAGALIFFIVRKRNLQRELVNQRAVFAATIEERKRISYDLHDHVGSQLSYVVNNLELIQHQENANERIERTFAMSQAAMNSLRDTVWALHSEELTVAALSERMENLARKMFENVSDVTITFQCSVNGAMLVQQQHTMHVIRIFQEAVNNVFKHARATRIDIELGETADRLYFSISDNGIGMGEHPQKPFHYGLSSMRDRAAKIGAELVFSGGPGEGVRVVLKWPKNNPIA